MHTNTQQAQAPVWQGGVLRCIERIDETPDTATFVLEAETPVRFEFLPGQFITIGVEIDGATHHRAYSIASSPLQSDRLALTIRRVEGGLVSNFLLDGFREGSRFESMAPAGAFYMPGDVAECRQVLLSSGCGITPVMSMARWLLSQRPDADIHFIYSARNESNVIYLRELLDMARRHPNFRLDLFLSQPEGRIPCHKGRTTPEQLDAVLENPKDSLFYLCGGEDYMHMVESWYRDRGLPPEHFHKESFASSAEHAAESSGEMFEMSVPSFGKTAPIADGQLLVDVMEAEELPIIVACRVGVCGSCKCKVVEGKVESTSTEMLTQEEIDDGVVLACSTVARSSVVIDL